MGIERAVGTKSCNGSGVAGKRASGTLMTEIVIFGRGGQGGVTLAKLIAMTYFLRDLYAQAFGVYAAERSGAPLRAFVRIDSQEIICRNQIYEPDHVVVLEPTLVDERITEGLKPGGWIILNTPLAPVELADRFPGYRLATLDASRLALDNQLGTRTTPILNTTMLGAIAKVFEVPFETVHEALADSRFLGGNLSAARQAYDSVTLGSLSTAECRPRPAVRAPGTTLSILDPEAGSMPEIKTGTWAKQRPHQREYESPCNDGCPAGNDVRGFLAAVRERDLDLALSILRLTSPFPAICGRVCPAPCMHACHRSALDQAVNIRELERYVADHADSPVRPVEASRESVAVIGSGPAGLSACYHLALLGYQVTLFEGQAELGGVMRTGIPAYRLPREVLDREIRFVLDHGIQVQLNARISRKDLVCLTQQHAALFVATGLQEYRALNLGDHDPAVVVEGVAFLDASRSGEVSCQGERVLVIGGGNTAVDAARTARRLGAREVEIVYRRTRAEMPAIAEETEEAIEEGIRLRELISPIRLFPAAGSWRLACRRMQLGEPDESGRRRPEPIEGPGGSVELECDRVILALGQSADLSVFPEGAEIREDGRLAGLTSAPVFSGGDLHQNAGTVTAAIGSGRKAAWHIHRTLSGEDLFPGEQHQVVPLKAVRLNAFTLKPQREAVLREPEERIRDFAEVRLGLEESPQHWEAWEESQRCFSCGSCTHCDVCRANCPEGILTRRGDEYAFNYDYCKGCGLCAFECPRGVIYMEQL
jgi:2-oxoacid:acceptor oxidoreductase gamma subunit (pyruvate/2-ketoisovalerate family)